jgi:tetratricopeptide (TPR) repeat protein
MKRTTLCGLFLFMLILFPFNLLAADYIAEADKLFELGGLANYKQAIDLYQKAIAHNPGSYEANWKCARAHREYGNAAKTEKVDGWKDICARYGKQGMNYARKATELEPEKPDGYYYFGLNVGIYSDGVSIFTALSEGLKDKTQSSFEKTYELEKMYKEGGSILALGRFWAMLPWPMRDRDKSLKYYREYQATEFFADNLEAHVYLAELLIQIGGDKNKNEAKGHLKRATQSNDPYFRDKAMDLLAKLNIN